MSTSSPSEWVSPLRDPSLSFFLFQHLHPSRRVRSRLVSSRSLATLSIFSLPLPPSGLASSAKDQLTGSSVAIKKIMKPFSTSVLSKRTYRELKLLKHIQHENVRTPTCFHVSS